MIRMFDKKVVDAAPGNPGKAAYIFKCSECTRSEAVHVGKPSGSLNASFLIKKMRQKGWAVGLNASHDVCPECRGIGRRTKKTTEPETIDMSNVTPIKHADAPPVMTKEDRRIIFSKIDEHYVDETSGYSDGWSDEKVAKDLNVPRAWVSQIREDNFGPEVGETVTKDFALISEQIVKANELLAEINRSIEDISIQYQESIRRIKEARDAFADNIKDASIRLQKIKR